MIYLLIGNTILLLCIIGAIIYRAHTAKDYPIDDNDGLGAVASSRPNSPDRAADGQKAVETWLTAQITHYRELIEKRADRHRKETPDVDEPLFGFTLALSAVLMIEYFLLVQTYTPTTLNIGTLPVNPQYLLYMPLGIYILAGFRKVDTDEVAGADFFGAPVHQFKRGLKWIPPFILSFNKEYSTFVQSEFPGDADLVQWSDEKTPLEPGKVRPIYVLSGENPDGKLASDKQQNMGVSALVKFQLVPERFFDLIMNVSPIDDAKRVSVLSTMTGGENVNESGLMLEIVRHSRDTTTAILREIAAQMSFNELNQHLHLVNTLLRLRLKETVVTWGIEIIEARITNVNPGHDFNTEIQLRATAEAQRDRQITLAEGEKQKRIREGEGTAAAELALLTARAEGYKKIAKSVSLKGGEVAVSSETAGKLAAAGNTIVVGTDGVKDLIGLVAAGKKVK